MFKKKNSQKNCFSTENPVSFMKLQGKYKYSNTKYITLLEFCIKATKVLERITELRKLLQVS